MVSEIKELKELDWPGQASKSALEPGFQISNFLAKLYINIYHINKHVDQLATIDPLGASLIFVKTKIYDAQWQITLNLKQ